jgi:hypothetical protein
MECNGIRAFVASMSRIPRCFIRATHFFTFWPTRKPGRVRIAYLLDATHSFGLGYGMRCIPYLNGAARRPRRQPQRHRQARRLQPGHGLRRRRARRASE